jgi:DNA repair exonuclease SbcCD nuclease subunit
MIIAIGDVHEKFREMKIKMQGIMNEKFPETIPINFIQVGDFGIGFNDPEEEYNELVLLDTRLFETNSNLYVIRGNHDRPSFWESDSYKFNNIHFIKDDTIITIEGKTCYFAGGGISIDRTERIHGVSYWDNEKYVFNYVEDNFKDKKIDILFTHDVYTVLSNLNFLESTPVRNWKIRDQKLNEDLIEQQNQIKKLYECVLKTNSKLKWYHGHYHRSYTNYVNEQTICCLDELEFKQIF